MFMTIEPKDHHFHRLLLNSFLELIKKNSVLSHSFQNHKEATFINFQDKKKMIFGGALLLKQKVTALHKKIGERITKLASKKGEIWTCTLCLQLENDKYPADFESVCETIYRDIYKKLAEFGIQKKIDYLCMVLEPGEHLCTEAIGAWPYVFELSSRDSLDNLFHGILSLTRNIGNSRGYREVELAA
jgi:hypothetical protein